MSEFEIDVEELRDGVRKLLSTESDSHSVREILQGDTARRSKLLQKIAELGWFGLAIDDSYGGLGQGAPLLAVLYEELGRQLTPVPLVPSLLAAQAIQLAGSESQKSRWLGLIAAGELLAGISFSDSVVACEANLQAGTRVRGQVTAVVDADQTKLILFPVEDRAGQKALVIAESSDPQIQMEWRPTLDETRRLYDIHIEEMILDEDNVLFFTDEQWQAWKGQCCLAVACDSFGGGSRILEETVEYMKIREQFGRAIGSFQALKHRCADWKILQEAVGALCGQAASAKEASAVWASRAKYYACDAYSAIAGDAIQLHGGIGFTWEHDCHLYFKRAKLNQVLLGDSAFHKDQIAQSVL